MEGIAELVGWPGAGAWGAFALAASVALVGQTQRHVRRAFHHWRLDRRLSRDRYILREELNEYELAIGEALEPLDAADIVKQSVIAGAVTAVPIWLAERHLVLWWEIALVSFGALGLLLAWWRWLNDPEAGPDALKLPKATIPVEAMAGFAGAIAVTGMILLAIWLL